ncbi:ACN9-domain-containing protein [Sistotremastrum suecicum HHB10207 ss-3]|uniref:Succinate dehydrogenase assembly factor 3 n=1 Tax=Sistotremastrum suecicum HHB10207 ss-3 TaxID=1314776 RepID=A0A165Y0M9_9AGAM|nr:ACN9-domain-containing protein [Sistotremastrum suecicum HHB10207 ss-3]
MHRTSLRLAESVTSRPLTLKRASESLLPPIPLYRRLLRAHRNLAPDMRSLGDDYVKGEFRRTKTTTNPVHIIGFLSEWKKYLDSLPPPTAPGEPDYSFKGKKLDSDLFEKMSAEQIGQLYELMHATKDVWRRADEVVDDKRGGEGSS